MNLKKKINFFTPIIHETDKKILSKTVRAGWISSQGKIVKDFESKFAKWHKMKYAISTSNCTTALHLSLLGLGIGPGDEVICSNLTFIAPANMISLTGAKLVLVDVNLKTFAMNTDEVEKKITKRTKAIMVIHPFGHPANISKLKAIAKKKQLKIIEDNAESIGAKHKNKLCGTFGDISCFSFFANKIMTTGEGGMILTNDKNIFDKIKLLRDHGMSENKKYFHKFLAFNYRMTSMQAAIGLGQLKRLKQIINEKKNIKKNYISFLKRDDIFIFPQVKYKKCVEWFVTITFKRLNLRDKFIKYMASNKIECRPMIFPVSFADHFKALDKKNKFPNAYKISLNSVHLPSSLNLKKNDIKRICKKINNWGVK
tara:strand:- start:73 stop:1182 length:1110 start_codon:yes stop_codon:yes gene_type:complete